MNIRALRERPDDCPAARKSPPCRGLQVQILRSDSVNPVRVGRVGIDKVRRADPRQVCEGLQAPHVYG